MMNLLTQDEIAELTGAVQPTAQARVLDQHGIRYLKRRDGRLSVALCWLQNPDEAGNDDQWEPDLSAI